MRQIEEDNAKPTKRLKATLTSQPKPILTKGYDCDDLNDFLSWHLQAISDESVDMKTAHEISSMAGKIIGNMKNKLIAKMWVGDKSGLKFFGVK